MRYRTELMKSILTDKTAQRIIDFVSPIYGNSYVGLWIYQAIGTVLSGAADIAARLPYEASLTTTDLLIEYWEKHYSLMSDVTMTKEQRRARLLSKSQSRGPCNPARLKAAISAALGGVEVDLTENVAQNTFRVDILDVVDSINPAVAVLERMKPAHLIYELRVCEKTVAEADIKTAIAMTHAENYKVEVLQ